MLQKYSGNKKWPKRPRNGKKAAAIGWVDFVFIFSALIFDILLYNHVNKISNN